MAKPEAPVVTQKPGEQRVELTWTQTTADPAVASFTVERRHVNGTYFPIAYPKDPAYSDLDVALGTTYEYHVNATNSDGVSPWSTAVEAKVPAEASATLTVAQFSFFLAVAGLTLLGLFIFNGATSFVPFPAIGADTTREAAIVQVGSYMTRWGLILLILTFIPAFALWAVTTVRVAQTPKAAAVGPGGKGGLGLPDVTNFLKVVPDLLKVPSGFAALLLVLGVALLVGGGLGDSSGAAGASPGPATNAPGSPAASTN